MLALTMGFPLTTWLFLAAVVGLLCRSLYLHLSSPLAKVPGPFIARFSRWWLAYHGWKGDFHELLTSLHEQYGDVVRIGPNEVVTISPEAVKKIYGAGSQFRKSEWYLPQQGERKFDLFAERDIIIHRNHRRLVNNAYATSSLMELEPYMDSAIAYFMTTLHDVQGQRIDFGLWLQLFAFDVIGEVTFSQRFGLMDAARESEALKQIKKVLRSTSWVGQVPWVYKIHQRLRPVIGNRLALTARNGSLRQFAMDQVHSRILRGSDHRDMLGRFVEINKAKPLEFDEAALVSMTASNIAAGSDTTAISLRSMIYYLLKNPHCLKKLVTEIDEETRGIPCDTVVTYEQANKMPYLQAVMNEALRIHSIVGHSMQRVVPRDGIQIGEYHIPSGTITGTSPYVLGRSEGIYGPDAKKFRPERWLEDGDKYDLWSGYLAFGGASRLCIGKNISWMEMSKVLATLLRNFVVAFADAETGWQEVC
ncbi:cytochrome P450 family protein [Exophiala viscosa]|uniref:Cytochrome P450 family protein n=2 Tax=Exophiala viscosa TaxID=2486360 RepID=A0AAN6E2W4_9EURO|nr:cytochrome P450 family protein [Exophiala viscosa]